MLRYLTICATGIARCVASIGVVMSSRRTTGDSTILTGSRCCTSSIGVYVVDKPRFAADIANATTIVIECVVAGSRNGFGVCVVTVHASVCTHTRNTTSSRCSYLVCVLVIIHSTSPPADITGRIALVAVGVLNASFFTTGVARSITRIGIGVLTSGRDGFGLRIVTVRTSVSANTISTASSGFSHLTCVTMAILTSFSPNCIKRDVPVLRVSATRLVGCTCGSTTSGPP